MTADIRGAQIIHLSVNSNSLPKYKTLLVMVYL